MIVEQDGETSQYLRRKTCSYFPVCSRNSHLSCKSNNSCALRHCSTGCGRVARLSLPTTLTPLYLIPYPPGHSSVSSARSTLADRCTRDGKWTYALKCRCTLKTTFIFSLNHRVHLRYSLF